MDPVRRELIILANRFKETRQKIEGLPEDTRLNNPKRIKLIKETGEIDWKMRLLKRLLFSNFLTSGKVVVSSGLSPAN